MEESSTPSPKSHEELTSVINHYIIYNISKNRTQTAKMIGIHKSQLSRFLNGANVSFTTLDTIVSGLCGFSASKVLVTHSCRLLNTVHKDEYTINDMVRMACEFKEISSITVDIKSGVAESFVREVWSKKKGLTINTADRLWHFLFNTTASAIIADEIQAFTQQHYSKLHGVR